MDYLPHYGFLPDLTLAEVERYVERGEKGDQRLRDGDTEGARRAYEEQLSIFPPNPQPFVSLALLEAGRGEREAALDYLHEAVVRGYVDLRSIERAEAWSRMGRSQRFQLLQDATALIVEMEDEFVDWSSFRVSRVPDSLTQVLDGYRDLTGRIEMMAPALGPRLTRLWTLVARRAAAYLLEAWIEAHPESPDIEEAVGRLMTLYALGPLLEWKRIPPDAATRLLATANLSLRRFPQSRTRPTALVARGLARNAWRDGDGKLLPDAQKDIRSSLEEVVADHDGSPVYATAVVGLIRTDQDTGQEEAARQRYRRFRAERASDPGLLQQVQDGLGPDALILGGVPDFEATALDGSAVGSEAIRDKVTVIDFWATWCAPCVDGFATLERIRNKHGDDVLLLGVSLDWAEDLPREDLQAWIAGRDVPGRHLWDGRSWDSTLVRDFGVREIPFTVVVGSDGEVLAVNEHGKSLQKAVQAAVRDGDRASGGSGQK
jgi:thiol-disulfide isomerase/thioredoxin